jgi:hypothetical protein
MKYLLFLLMFISTKLVGQDVNDIAERKNVFLDSLRKSGVDTVLGYSLECSGSAYPYDTCSFFDDYYLFWMQGELTWVQKFDGCKNYIPLLLEPTNPLTYYVTRSKRINNEIIYRPTFVESRKANIITTIELTVDHACYYNLTFLIGELKVVKIVNDYDLTYKLFDNGRKNIYYNSNQQTQLKKLIDMLILTIDSLTKHKRMKAH